MFKIILWSDYFECTLVWTMVWNSSGQWSGTCLIGVTSVWNSPDQRRLRAHFERTMIFERILVWSEVTSVWDGLIRGPTCLGRSDQRRFRARPQPGYFRFRCHAVGVVSEMSSQVLVLNINKAANKIYQSYLLQVIYLNDNNILFNHIWLNRYICSGADFWCTQIRWKTTFEIPLDIIKNQLTQG